MTDKEIRTTADEDRQEDLDLRDEDAADVAGGATADASLDAGIHFKYDIKATK